MKIAIIGSGIAGLTSAYHLDNKHNIVVYEKNNYLGGHTDTHNFKFKKKEQRIDSGFIIFCPEYYPNFCKMLTELNVASKPTNMSFGVTNEISGTQYSATNLDSMFSQRKNLINPRFIRMLLDIVRFYQFSPKVLNTDDDSVSIGDYLKKKKYSKAFMQDHLFPMIGALWSCHPKLVQQFPIRYLIEFLQAHGLLKIFNRPQWRVLEDGSNGYIKALRSKLRNTEFRINCGVTNIIREDNRVLIHSVSAQPEYFDAVFIASHADQARMLLQKPSAEEYDILGAIPFQKNDVTVHTDENLMPPIRKSWSSWNVHIPNDATNHYNSCYWMNSLQSLNLTENVIVSLNEKRYIDPDKILKKRVYHHPSYTIESVRARKRLSEINGKNRTFYAGAFWAWGFHEDGARTAVDAVKLFEENINKGLI